jgi:hypothetical protein
MTQADVTVDAQPASKLTCLVVVIYSVLPFQGLNPADVAGVGLGLLSELPCTVQGGPPCGARMG